ncbi:uncharacterized protein SCHCODRAFT_02518608 [Schizophyllum commune H4-8]|nr:uncharacterized protein SCHCODRAFT_02517987 [Schizophyllum commune H4-8]XP_003027672.1 uncharacterized protein SCHCODRAFT_02672494 [Schizophyllum commune H4-8]XP_003031564.1 uncharacterized protein SCHCODRAFT_02504022 [Schizophyllum commune H4-8]XP_003036360.1 uncharacterized protein SCHCODRAFT_01106029 [Schizophyllum commune H4-8]XP_050197466.1 uncharacterized protein SCHCODRAFT_02518608 [Schizophyllum commune H4-8]KAI4517278.1 hypothetical protein K525DRAFT_289863 [Schizophyllum commune L
MNTLPLPKIYAHLEQTLRERREAELERDILAHRLSRMESDLRDSSARVLQLEGALQQATLARRKDQDDHVATKREYLEARAKLDNASNGWSAAVRDVGACCVCGAPAVGTVVPCGHSICESGHKMRDCDCDLPFGTPGRCMAHGTKARCPYHSCEVELDFYSRHVNLAIDVLSAKHAAMCAAEEYCKETMGYAAALTQEFQENEVSVDIE